MFVCVLNVKVGFIMTTHVDASSASGWRGHGYKRKNPRPRTLNPVRQEKKFAPTWRKCIVTKKPFAFGAHTLFKAPILCTLCTCFKLHYVTTNFQVQCLKIASFDIDSHGDSHCTEVISTSILHYCVCR